MRRNGLCRSATRALRRGALPCVLLLLGACAAAPAPDEPATASRTEVTIALYTQFQLVLDRHSVLSDVADPAAQDEREQLVRLAAEIAVRIVRVDPDADVRDLVKRMETLR